MFRNLGLILTLFGYAHLFLGGSFVVCVHTDGQEKIEWADGLCCLSKTAGGTPSLDGALADSCCDCKDYPLVTNADLSQSEVKQVVENRLIDDSILYLFTTEPEIETGSNVQCVDAQAPPGLQFLTHLLTVVIRC